MEHGGDIYGNLNIELDFSVNLSPAGPPEAVRRALREMLEEACQEDKAQSALTCYPDPECRELRRELSRKLEVPEKWILCGNGASELLMAAVQAIRPGKAVIPVPTYQGYERALQASGTEICCYPMKREEGYVLTDRILEELDGLPEGSMLFLCNPNNPVGNCIDRALLARIAERCRTGRVFLLVDECYLELLQDGDERSMRRFVGENPYLLILNAFTKSYAVPGLRLGYLLTENEPLREKIRLQQPEWSVSMIAQRAGVAALREESVEGRQYLAHAAEMIRTERKYVCGKLREYGAQVLDGEAGFVLFSCSSVLYEPLRARGILIRRCDEIRGVRKEGESDHYYRIGLRKHSDNARLMEEIGEIMNA